MNKFFNVTGKFGILISWFVTQVCVFFTWLIFRVEETSILIPSMKTFFGIGGHFDLGEMYDFLPEIKLLTVVIVVAFIILHGISGKVGGGKMWLSRRHPIIWGIICGVMLSLTFYLRPAETVDFIYFRF